MNYFKKFIILNMRAPWNHISFKSKRLFYSPSSLGMDSFVSRRESVKKNNQLNVDVYKKRIKEACNEESNILVFSNDLIKMIYLAEDNDDLHLVHKLLKKITSQKLIRVQNYNIGPEILRLHYLMNRPIEAMALVKDQLLYPEFRSSASFILLLDMLFENELYEELITMYHYKMSRSELNFNAFLHLLYFAACYKLDTKQSFEKAFKLWQDLSNIGYKPGIHIRLFFAALSLNQGHIFCAMEVLPVNKFNTLSENIKSIILAKSKRFKDAFECLRQLLNNDKEDVFVLTETISAVGKEISDSNEEDIVHFQYIKEDLSNRNKIKDVPLDSCLCAKLEYKSQNQKY